MIVFQEGKFKEIVETLEKNGYSIPDVIGPTLCIYPNDELSYDFIPLGRKPRSDYPFKFAIHGRILNWNDITDEIGHRVQPLQCAYIDFEKNVVGFDYPEFPTARKHHRIISELVSPFKAEESP
jgi:hypothetical protein